MGFLLCRPSCPAVTVLLGLMGVLPWLPARVPPASLCCLLQPCGHIPSGCCETRAILGPRSLVLTPLPSSRSKWPAPVCPALRGDWHASPLRKSSLTQGLPLCRGCRIPRRALGALNLQHGVLPFRAPAPTLARTPSARAPCLQAAVIYLVAEMSQGASCLWVQDCALGLYLPHRVKLASFFHRKRICQVAKCCHSHVHVCKTSPDLHSKIHALPHLPMSAP